MSYGMLCRIATVLCTYLPMTQRAGRSMSSVIDAAKSVNRDMMIILRRVVKRLKIWSSSSCSDCGFPRSGTMIFALTRSKKWSRTQFSSSSFRDSRKVIANRSLSVLLFSCFYSRAQREEKKRVIMPQKKEEEEEDPFPPVACECVWRNKREKDLSF